MLGIKRIDHVSVVNSDLEGRIKFYSDLFGMEVAERFETKDGGFKGVALNIPGSPTQWEILEPFGDDSFLHRFLEQRGPGMHHATFEVEDISKAAAALRAYGVEPFGESTAGDWKQLFIGTTGAFGVITECVLNLEPAPKQSATALLVPASPEAVATLLVAMEDALGSYLSAFEGMSGNAVRAALDHVPSLRNPFQGGVVPDFVILAEISRSTPPREGEQPLDAVLEEVLAAIWEQEGAPLTDAFVGPPHEIWALRHALSEGVKHSGRLIAFDLSFRRGDIMPFLAHMKAEMPDHFEDVTICDFGHIGDGGVHFNLVVVKDDPRLADPDFEADLRAWVFTVAVEGFGGSFSAEHGIGRKNQIFYDQYTPEKIRALAAGLKSITSPGLLGTMTF